MSKFLSLFLILAGFSFGCVRTNFYQKTALVNPAASVTPGDSVMVTVGKHYKKSKFHTIFFGKHYRDLWAMPVKLPIFDMRREFGGLKPVSLGGGFQTTSLTLKDKNGRPYVLRSLDKDPIKTLPPFLRKTFVVNVIRDQTSAGNPFAPLVVPDLSKAAGVYFTHPNLFYVAENDSTLGKFGDRIRGKVMLLEEKYDGKEAMTPMFGKADDLVDSEDVLEDHFKDSRHQFDQQLFARSRLFDIFIGDWDRHEGQWQWAAFKQGNKTVYQPIPKDRDQVFYLFEDGLIPWIASNRYLIKKFQTFKKDYSHIPGWLFNARFIDARLLNQVTREDWRRHAEAMQAGLTDAAIEKAFTNWPEPVRQKRAADTMAKLRSRRQLLTDAADKVYLHLAKEVLVAGSDEDEIFEIKRLPNGETQIIVYMEADETKTPFFQRTFKPEETREINLYCLGGKDEILISGEGKKSIDLNVYGGEGEDELTDTSKISGWGKNIHVYDTWRGIIMEPSKEAKRHRSRSVEVHAFDREGL